MNKIINNATEILESLDFNSLNIIEKMYEIYQSNPQKLDQKWATIFQSLSKQISNTQEEELQIKPSWFRKDWPPNNITDEIASFDGQWLESSDLKINKNTNAGISEIKTSVLDSIRALMFIRAYRVRGHLAANLDPLSNYEIKKLDPALDLSLIHI